MTRKERRQQAARKRLNIQQTAWGIFKKEWKDTEDWNVAVQTCQAYFNNLINQ